MSASPAKKVEQYPAPAKGDAVSYRSIDGTFWRAIVLDVRGDGTLDVECGVNPPLKLTKRPWWARNPADCPKRVCTIREMAENQR